MDHLVLIKLIVLISFLLMGADCMEMSNEYRDGVNERNFNRERPEEQTQAFGWDTADKILTKSVADKEALNPQWKGKINVYFDQRDVEIMRRTFYRRCVGEFKPVFLKTQSEHLDEFDYDGMSLRLSGCQNNLPLYFRGCFKDPGYSEAQIGARIKKCNKETWHKFFDCTQLYPKPTLSEEIERDL